MQRENVDITMIKGYLRTNIYTQ